MATGVEAWATGFIGRERELAEIDALLDASDSGNGSCAFISGEAGIGKSALLRHASHRAEEKGFLVAWGRCWEQPGSPPLWPWVQVLRQVLSTPEGSHAVEKIGRDAAFIHDLLHIDPVPREHEEGSRFILFDAVTRLIADASAARPVLLVFDDLHAADPAALLLLKFVARSIAATRSTVLGAHRPATDEIDALLADASAEARRIPVPPLTPDEARVLFERTSGKSIPDDQRDRLVRATGGNTLLVSELALIARERPILDVDEDVALTDTVRTTVHLRLKELPPQTRRLLAAASVIGRDIERNLVIAVAEVQEEDLAGAIEPAIKQRIVSVTEAGWAFVHDLIRQVLYQDMTPSERAVLHIRAADAIEQSARTSQHRAAEIAHHLLRATGKEVRARALTISRRAGDSAMAKYAYELAESHYQNALRLLDADAPDIIDLLLDVARAQLMQGNNADGRATCFDAIALAEKRDDVVGLARALATLSENRYVSKFNADEQVIGLVDRVLPRLTEEHSKLRSSLMALRAMELWAIPEHAPRRDEAAQIHADIEAARRSSDDDALAHALKCFVIVAGPDDLDRRIEASRELMDLARAMGLPGSELLARASLLGCFIERGDVVAFDQESARLVARAESVSHPLHLWVARSVETAQAAIRCDFERVTRLADEALAFSQQAEYMEGMIAWALAKICIGEHCGMLTEAEPYIQAGKDMAPNIPTIRAGLAVIQVESGRAQEAQLELGPLMPELEAAPKTPQWLAAMGLVGRAAAGIGDPAGCKEIYELLLPYAARHHYIPLGQPVSYHGCIAHTLGRLASVLDLRDAALEHLEHALELHKRMGTPAWTAWTQYELGRLLLEGTENDRARGEALLGAATDTARELGLSGVSEAIGRVERRPRRTGSRALSLAVEGDYWAVAHNGRTFRIKDMRGLHYLAILLGNPDREFHALDLLMAVAGTEPHEGQKKHPVATDALLDPTAKAAYKRRIDELREEIEDADSYSDIGRREQAQRELDFLTEQLSAALGIGGRDRTWSDPGEKARVSVTKSLKRALRKIAEQDAELGRFLDVTIETGIYCCFKGSASAWEVSASR